MSQLIANAIVFLLVRRMHLEIERRLRKIWNLIDSCIAYKIQQMKNSTDSHIECTVMSNLKLFSLSESFSYAK